jgi:Putative Flp pilus-assembly TadE/G-like
MTTITKLMRHSVDEGQVLVIAALMMTVLIGFTALAIDVSAALLSERSQRSVADAAALAGAQSLQKPDSRELPGAVEQAAARSNAMHVLEERLGGTDGPGDCYTSAGCELTGTPYHVSIQTPSPSCVDCVGRRAVQVSIWQPNFGLTFGRILGPENWTVRSTSVAGMVVAPQYGLVTLRPSRLRPNDSDANFRDLSVNGGSVVVVGNADVATNSNAVCSGAASGSEIRVDTAAGFDIHHFGAGAAWLEPSGLCVNPPPGFQVTTLIADPEYAIPGRDDAVPWDTVEAGEADAATCEAQQLLVPDAYRELKTGQQINDPSLVSVTCLRPGIYDEEVTVQDPSSGLPNAVLLLPGVYFFDAGLDVASTIIGGYEASQPGVALVFLEARNSSGIPGQFRTSSNDSLVALNFGNLYCPPGGPACPTGAAWASPAVGPDGLVQTPAPNPTLMTVMVVADEACEVVSPPPSACDENDNQTLKLTGGGNIYLAGVQYAPSDNATLTGSSGQESDVGAFWAWTMEFNGGSTFNLTSRIPQSAGVLRIDPACSPNVATCNP